MLALQTHTKLFFFVSYEWENSHFDKDHKNRNSFISSWRHVWLQAFEDILSRAFKEFQMSALNANSKMLKAEVSS